MKTIWFTVNILLVVLGVIQGPAVVLGFTLPSSSSFSSHHNPFKVRRRQRRQQLLLPPPPSSSSSPSWSKMRKQQQSSSPCIAYLFNNDNENNKQKEKDEEAVRLEEGRLRVWDSRRKQIRWMFKNAEGIRNNRINNGWIPELYEDGTPKQKSSDGRVALTLTAFVVAGGAVALRIGGRAALVSVVGLDFLTDNPELQSQVNQVLAMSETVDPLIRLCLFSLAWTIIKVFCFDAGGVVLALSSGILFGGVLQGAIISAFGATVGSSVAFTLAKLDTPIRTKALQVVEDNPSLKGIERVVAEDGLKAILTLRLAPVLPIPIGLYNYVYGVTKVPYFDFAGGIFLGSLKPYLLDSYLGYFGKEVIDGTAGKDGGLQDILLLVAIGFSVAVGVFASQLAGETWDAVLQEEEVARKKKKEGLQKHGQEEDDDDGLAREVFGMKLPQWVVGFQLALRDADYRINALILQEFNSQVWNYTDSKGANPIPPNLDPAFWCGSPEIAQVNQGVDFGALTCDGLVLSPALFSTGLKIADPLFKEDEFINTMEEQLRDLQRRSYSYKSNDENNIISTTKDGSLRYRVDSSSPSSVSPISAKEEMLKTLQSLRQSTLTRMEELNKRKGNGG